MADFEKAVELVLGNEGGFVDNANDPGGATNFGISLRLLKSLPSTSLHRLGIFHAAEDVSGEDLKALTRDQAKEAYHLLFWDDAAFSKIANDSICSYVFDMAVLHGLSQAIKILQRAFWAVNYSANFVKDDGILGDYTLSMITKTNVYDLKIALSAERAGFVRLLAAIRPNEKEFLNGWLTRCYKF